MSAVDGRDPDRILAATADARHASEYRFAWGTYLGWCILTLSFYSYYGLYHLIRRRDDHAKRRIAFAAALYHALAGRADEAGKRDEVQAGLDNLARVHAMLQEYESRNRRNPVLLLVLRLAPALGGQIFNVVNAVYTGATTISHDGVPPTGSPFVPFVAGLSLIAAAVGAYTNDVLNKDFRFYEEWEDAMFANVAWVAERVGITIAIPHRHTPYPRRNTALYVVLTIVTFGLFAVAWRYMMMNDGNVHLDADDRAEDAVLAALGIRSVAPPAGAFGAPGPPMPPPMPPRMP